MEREERNHLETFTFWMLSWNNIFNTKVDITHIPKEYIFKMGRSKTLVLVHTKGLTEVRLSLFAIIQNIPKRIMSFRVWNLQWHEVGPFSLILSKSKNSSRKPSSGQPSSNLALFSNPHFSRQMYNTFRGKKNF